MEEVVCRECCISKPISDFYVLPNGKPYWCCRSCKRTRHRAWKKSHPDSRRQERLKRRYGMTILDRANLISSQNGSCPGCGKYLLSGRGTHIDHLHGMRVVRGVLCRHCNLILGLVNDDPAILENLAKYLEKQIGSTVLT